MPFRLQELVRLHRMGAGSHEMARQLGMSPNTERLHREALAAAGLLEGWVHRLSDEARSDRRAPRV